MTIVFDTLRKDGTYCAVFFVIPQQSDHISIIYLPENSNELVKRKYKYKDFFNYCGMHLMQDAIYHTI